MSRCAPAPVGAVYKDLIMSPFGQVAAAAAMATLAACASPRNAADTASADIAAYVATLSAMPIMVSPNPISDFDAMRAALPSFDLQRSPWGFDHRGTWLGDNLRTLASAEFEMRLTPLPIFRTFSAPGQRPILTQGSDGEIGRRNPVAADRPPLGGPIGMLIQHRSFDQW